VDVNAELLLTEVAFGVLARRTLSRAIPLESAERQLPLRMGWSN
jgi:hypothetical protein